MVTRHQDGACKPLGLRRHQPVFHAGVDVPGQQDAGTGARYAHPQDAGTAVALASDSGRVEEIEVHPIPGPVVAGETRTRTHSRKLLRLPAEDTADGELAVQAGESARVIPVCVADDEGVDVPHALMLEIREDDRSAGVEAAGKPRPVS